MARAFGWLGIGMLSCDGPADPSADADTDTDGDTDTDTDSDTDTDADTDTDTDADAEPDLRGERLLDEAHVLVMPDADGLAFRDAAGAVVWSRTWTELVGSCETCGGEGSSWDGDGLLLSFTTQGPTTGGAVARLDGAGALDWRVDGFGFPHDAERDPADGTVIVPEVNGSVVTWIAGDGSSDATVRSLDTRGHPEFPGDLPNGAERFDHEGRSLLLLSHRGSGGGPGGGSGGSGEITLWDITTAGAPDLLWTYPGEGRLDTPHGPVFRWWNGQWWLLYAHTEGATSGGSVGVAVTDDPTTLPAYVADLLPPDDVGAFGFVRGVELTSDGRLWITDSGGTGGDLGKLVVADLPDLAPTGASGSADEDQVFVELAGAEALARGLANPFEGWLWAPTFDLR